MALSNRWKWQQAVDAWVQSGFSCRDFAAHQGLNFRSLSWWKWKLSSAGSAHGPTDNSPATSSSPPFSFVELVLGVWCQIGVLMIQPNLTRIARKKPSGISG
ncbi:MAG: hypothetical protein HUU55_09335 [Myxococcales bacterium]|nr:hypothetical protein [Myxococcales bacterium]